MGNLVWTAILYASTLSIAYMIYRCFMFERVAEKKQSTSDLVERSYGKKATLQPARPAATSSPVYAWQKRPVAPKGRIAPR
jgi:hypothetical protein